MNNSITMGRRGKSGWASQSSIRQLATRMVACSGVLAAAFVAVSCISPANAVELMRDDFNGASLDTTKWNQYEGYTTFAGGVATLHVDTYNPAAPGYLRVSGINAVRIDTRGTLGLEYEARVRVNNPPLGLNAAFCSINPGASPQGEIDNEMLTNNRAKIWTNTWKDWNQFSLWQSPSGYNMTNWNVMKIRYYPDRSVEMFINGTRIRRVGYNDVFGLYRKYLPDSPMQLMMSYWKPGSAWTQAYNSQLDAAATTNPAANVSYTYDIDYAVIRTIY